jgi:hypothetical protein
MGPFRSVSNQRGSTQHDVVTHGVTIDVRGGTMRTCATADAALRRRMSSEARIALASTTGPGAAATGMAGCLANVP